MERCLLLYFSTYCKQRFYRELFARIKEKHIFEIKKKGMVLQNIYNHNTKLCTNNMKTRTLLNSTMPHCPRRRIPLVVSMCCFHTSGEFQRLHRTGKNGRKKYEVLQSESSLENKNWNVKSDLGLSALYEEMEKEMTGLENTTKESSKTITGEDLKGILDYFISFYDLSKFRLIFLIVNNLCKS